MKNITELSSKDRKKATGGRPRKEKSAKQKYVPSDGESDDDESSESESSGEDEDKDESYG
jgi:hypothetical protein